MVLALERKRDYHAFFARDGNSVTGKLVEEVLPEIRRTGGYAIENLPAPSNSLDDTIQQTILVAEIVRQLVPTILSQVHQEQPSFTITVNNLPAVKKPRRTIRHRCKIEQLPIELRREVDDLFISNQYTTTEICEWLKNHGQDISRSSVGRYYCIFRDQLSAGKRTV